MRRPRIKCVLCGKRRVPPHSEKSMRWFAGRKTSVMVEWTATRLICDMCNNDIAKLMCESLQGKI